MIVKSSVMDILGMGMSPQVVVCKLYLEGIPLFRQLYFTSDVYYYFFNHRQMSQIECDNNHK